MVPLKDIACGADVLIAVQPHRSKRRTSRGRTAQAGKTGQFIRPPITDEPFDDGPFSAVHRPDGACTPEKGTLRRVKKRQIAPSINSIRTPMQEKASHLCRAVRNESSDDGPDAAIGTDTAEAKIVPFLGEIETGEWTGAQRFSHSRIQGMLRIDDASFAFRVVLRQRAGRTGIRTFQRRQPTAGLQPDSTGINRYLSEPEDLSGQLDPGKYFRRDIIADHDDNTVFQPDRPLGYLFHGRTRQTVSQRTTDKFCQ